MRSLSGFTVGLLLLLLAFGNVSAQPQQGYIPEFSCEGGPYGLRFPSRLPDVMKLGPVKKDEVLEVEKWEGYTTTRKYIYFAGLTIGLATFSNDKNRYMVSFVEITDQRWNHISPFRIGETISSARKKIGSPTKGDPSLSLHYGSEGGDIYFESAEGKIRKVTYDCHTG